MILWLQPAALLALAAVGGPVLVHLLLRARARRLVFPTLRLMPRRATSSTRLRRPSDPWLLLVRAAILAVAALALAQPVLLTGARTGAWSARMARAIVVDQLALGHPDLAGVLDAERRTSVSQRVFEVDELPQGIQRASDWLGHAVPARREIVVVSSFPVAAIFEADVAAIPPAIGVRFVRLPVRFPARRSIRERILGAEGVREQVITLDGAVTAVRLGRPAPLEPREVRIEAGEGRDRKAERLRAVVSRAGAQLPPHGPTVSIRFDGKGSAAETVARAAQAGGAAAALRLLATPEVADIPFQVNPVRSDLRVTTSVAADSFEAAALVSAALAARMDPQRHRSAEILTIPDTTLREWTRAAPRPTSDQWRNTDESDARWLWALVLLLLVAETAMRRRRAPADAVPERAHAA